MQVRNRKQETNEVLIIMAVLIGIVFYYLGVRKKTWAFNQCFFGKNDY